MPAHLDGWWAEPKLDGWRLVVTITPGGVVARTRHGNTVKVPGLGALAATGVAAVLDGELVAGPGTAASFYKLMPAVATRATTGVAFMVFDLLWLDGQLLTALPYEDRRAALETLRLPAPHGMVPRWPATAAGELLDACAALDLEGLVVKRGRSVYRPGERTRWWRKVKAAGWAERHAGRRHPRA